ncbi:MAG: GlsB/YeaQ/YmgE family stress response membrane protein [Polyangiaceae bacterium]
MSLLLFLVFGFVVGLVARALMPGKQSLSLLWTTLLGIAGSFLGGMLWSLFFHYRVLDLHPSGFIGSVIGAMLVLGIASYVRRRS